MRLQRLLISNCVGLVFGISLLVAGPAEAHVQLNAPNGGQHLPVCSVYTIEWQIVIAHSLLNWDLAYSVSGAGGPWIEIASDLPAGSGAVGSIHTYDWTIPDTITDQMRVRVIMDNSGTDYQDISASNSSITPSAIVGDLDGDCSVSVTDLLLLFSRWGPCDNCKACPEDLDGDCVVNVTDLLILFANWG